MIRNQMKKFAITLIGLLSLQQIPAAQAAPAVQFNEIRLTGLQKYSGKSLTVFYVASYKPVLSSSGSQPQVRAVTSMPLKMEIPSSGEITLPAREVRHPGALVTNLVIFAVHSPSMHAFYLHNLDQSVPSDPRLSSAEAAKSLTPSDFEMIAVKQLPIRALNELRARKAGSGPAAIEFDTLSQ